MATAKDLMSRDYLAVDTTETVSKLIGKMKEKHITFALVFQGRKYRGMIDKRFLLTSRIDTSRMKINNILKKRSKSKTPFFVPKLNLDTSLDEICRLMATSNARALPVLEKEIVLGVVTTSRVLAELKKLYKGIKAEELVRRKLITAQEQEQIGKVIEKMHLLDADKIPVVDKLDNLVGIVTVNDIMKYFHRWPPEAQKTGSRGIIGRVKKGDVDTGEKQDVLKMPIRNLMIPANICCTAGMKTPVPMIIDMMLEEHVSSVILEEKLKPVGIITAKDILEDYTR